MKTYRPWNPQQSYLLPPSPSDWLPEGHLAYFIIELVGELDLRAITSAIDARDARGVKPYSPAMMTALLLYAYCVGVFSSRRIERATYEDVAFRVITGDEHPHHTRISEFRRKHLDAFADIFVQSVKLCEAAGMVSLGAVALDGTKVQGNASKHKAMSYERMVEHEQNLKSEVESLLRRAEQADASDDARCGAGQREEDLPEELRHRQGRLKKIREAKRALEQEALRVRADAVRAQSEKQQSKAESESDPIERKRAATRAHKREEEAEALEKRIDDDDDPPPQVGTPSAGLDGHRVPTTSTGEPHAKAQLNFTDPQSRIQEKGGSFLQGYNCQAAVDSMAQVIVAQGVTNLQPDNSHMLPMLDQVTAICGRPPTTALADAGYWHPNNATGCEERGIDAYIATRRTSHKEPPSQPDDDPSDARARMTTKITSETGRERYAPRKYIVEPVFGQLKEARGMRRFLLRGLKKVAAEWALLTATHNLLKLHRHRPQPATA